MRQYGSPPGTEPSKNAIRTWLITGASSGLGFALAERALQCGDRVVLTAPSSGIAPSTDCMNDLALKYPRRALVVELDVTKPTQRGGAVEKAEAHFGGIDVLVNNGPARDAPSPGGNDCEYIVDGRHREPTRQRLLFIEQVRS